MDTLLVGIDAACLPVLEPLFQDGAIPTLQSIFDSGAGGPLESQIPPWTSSAWPSLYTGTNPGKHGVFDFLSFDGYDWDVVNASHIRERTLWEIADYHGLTSVVVNAPVTHPPREFDGALIPGYVSPEDPRCHPEGILDDVRREIGDYRVYSKKGLTDEEMTDEYVALTRMRGEAFRYLADRFDPEFGFVQFQQTDTVFHEYPGDMEKVRAIYEEVDRQLAAIIEEFDPETVVIASDHGMGEYNEYEFRVNDFLRNQGFVETKQGGAQGMPSWSTIWDDQLSKGEESGPRQASALERGMALAAKFGLTSQRMGAVLEKLGLDEFVIEHVPTGAISAATEQVDFENSTAYMRSRIECGIRINLEGREPNGTVPQDQYEAVRERLISLLTDVKTPSGDPMFEDVAPREKYFSGPAADDAVDVVLVPTNFDQFLSAQLRGEEFGEPAEPWNHKRYGVVAASGDSVHPDADLAGAHLFDVAPTVLASLGLPASDRMDGRVLPLVDEVGTREYPEFESGTETETNDSEVESRLADLGYLE